MILRFRAYSMKNRDADVVYREGKIRGTLKGDPMLVFGNSIEESEFNLNIVREALMLNDNITFIDNKHGSFSIKIKE